MLGIMIKEVFCVMAIEYYLGKRELISLSDSESSYGTAATRKLLLGVNAALNPINASNWEEVKGAGSGSVTIDDRASRFKSVGFTLNFVPQDWRFLKFVLTDGSSGAITESASGGDYTHNFSNSNTVGSFSVERGFKASTDKARLYTGCQVNNFTLSFDAGAGGFVSCGLDVLAREVSNSGVITSLNKVATKGFLARQASLKIDGDVELKCLSGSFVVNNNLDAGRYANYDNDNLLKSESSVTTRRISGSFVVNVKDETYFDLWKELDKVSGSCSLKLSRSANDYAEFSFSDFRIEDAPDDTNLDGINTVTINWVAKDVSASAKDKISSYKTF